MSRTVTIAAIQLPAWAEGTTPTERKNRHLERIEHWLRAAGRASADLAVLGETCTTYGIDAPGEDGEIFEDAADGPSARLVSRLAREYAMHIVLPIAARRHGRLQNLALVFDRHGTLVGDYAKVHPTRGEQRRPGIVPGDDFPVFDLDFGRLGIVICHDLSFPESTRVLALRGAEVICWPHWWSGWGEELCNAVIKSRAIDNGAYLVAACFGQPDGKAWRPGMVQGNSGVIGPDGLTLSSAGRYVGLAVCTIDLDRPRIAHSWTDSGETVFRDAMLGDRRPDAYRPIADETLAPRGGQPLGATASR